MVKIAAQDIKNHTSKNNVPIQKIPPCQNLAYTSQTVHFSKIN